MIIFSTEIYLKNQIKCTFKKAQIYKLLSVFKTVNEMIVFFCIIKMLKILFLNGKDA